MQDDTTLYRTRALKVKALRIEGPGTYYCEGVECTITADDWGLGRTPQRAYLRLEDGGVYLHSATSFEERWEPVPVSMSGEAALALYVQAVRETREPYHGYKTWDEVPEDARVMWERWAAGEIEGGDEEDNLPPHSLFVSFPKCLPTR
jgi:hypothetical protein